MKKLFLILFFSSIFTNIFAAGQLDTKNKGELNVYGCCEEAYLVAACQKFEKMYGIKTHYQRLSTVEALERIADAHGAPSADIWFGGTTDPFNEAATKGLLLPYEARNACHLTEKLYKDPQNRWYGIYLGILGFYWNKTELRRLKLDPPKDWEDLINPKYQGLIAFGSPKTSGTGRMVVNTIVQHRGEESAMAYFKKLNKNVAFYTESGITPAKLLATGEVVIGIGFLHDALCQIVDYNYDNIGLTVPYSGTSYEIGPVAILAGCKNEENAKKFIEFALSPDCVSLAQKNGSYQLLLLDNAPPVKAALSAGLEKTADIGYDFEDARLNGEDYCNMFFQTISEDN